MTQERRAELTAAGIDVEAALERLLGSEALLERLLGKFPEDGNYQALRSALETGDLERAADALECIISQGPEWAMNRFN